METKSQFIVTPEGFFREDITRREVMPSEALQKAFATTIVATTRDFLELPGHGLVHCVYEQATAIWHFSVPMETINFRTTFKPITEATYKDQLYPSFLHKDSEETVMEIEWNRAEACSKQDAQCKIRFLVQVKQNAGGGYYAYDHYLFAFDGRGVAYRMPLANLYDTCQVCMGQYDSKTTSAMGSVIQALRQFRIAPWNSDLFRTPETVWKFVRFKALEKGFATQPIVGSWTTLCERTSPPQLKFCQV